MTTHPNSTQATNVDPRFIRGRAKRGELTMASWWQKTLAGAAGLVGLAGGAFYLLMRRPLPKTKGELHLHGLHEAVEVITDRYGVPHIYAQNEDDLFFA